MMSLPKKQKQSTGKIKLTQEEKEKGGGLHVQTGVRAGIDGAASFRSFASSSFRS